MLIYTEVFLEPQVLAWLRSWFKNFCCTLNLLQEIASWNRHGVDTTDDSHPKLSLYVNECIELQMSLLPDTTESQSDRSSTEDDSDENEESLVLRLQQGIKLFETNKN